MDRAYGGRPRRSGRRQAQLNHLIEGSRAAADEAESESRGRISCDLAIGHNHRHRHGYRAHAKARGGHNQIRRVSSGRQAGGTRRDRDSRGSNCPRVIQAQPVYCGSLGRSVLNGHRNSSAAGAFYQEVLRSRRVRLEADREGGGARHQRRRGDNCQVGGNRKGRHSGRRNRDSGGVDAQGQSRPTGWGENQGCPRLPVGRIGGQPVYAGAGVADGSGVGDRRSRGNSDGKRDRAGRRIRYGELVIAKRGGARGEARRGGNDQGDGNRQRRTHAAGGEIRDKGKSAGVSTSAQPSRIDGDRDSRPFRRGTHPNTCRKPSRIRRSVEEYVGGVTGNLQGLRLAVSLGDR